MSNIVTTDIDNGQIALGDNQFEDGTFNASDSLAAGTILARDTTNQKWRIFVKGGATNGNGIPGGVLTYADDALVDGKSVRVLISGPVNKNRLVIDADGDDSNIDGAVKDGLRARSIIPSDVEQLALDDNPQQVDS